MSLMFSCPQEQWNHVSHVPMFSCLKEQYIIIKQIVKLHVYGKKKMVSRTGI